MAEEVSSAPDPREMDMLLSTGRADLVRAVCDGDQRSGSPRDLADGIPGRDRDRRVPHQGADPRRAGRPHQGGPRARTTSCSWPASRGSRGRQATSRRSAAAARTRAPSRSPPRWARTSAKSTPTSPASTRADPRIVPDARKLDDGVIRGDARDGGVGSGRAATALGRVRPQPRRAHPLSAHPSTTEPGTVVVAEGETMEQPLITAVTHSVRGAGHAHRRARRPGRGGAYLRGAGAGRT